MPADEINAEMPTVSASDAATKIVDLLKKLRGELENIKTDESAEVSELLTQIGDLEEYFLNRANGAPVDALDEPITETGYIESYRRGIQRSIEPVTRIREVLAV